MYFSISELMKMKLFFLLVVFSTFLFASSTEAVAQPSCLGGQVQLDGGINSLVQCFQNDNPVLFPQNNSTAVEDVYLYVLTNNSATIITIFEETEGIDLNSYAIGTYRIYGYSYTGVLNTTTTQEGLSYWGITSNDCFSFSSTYITIVRSNCGVGNCHGGEVYTNHGDTYISICKDGESDVFTFTTTATGDVNYTYIIVDDQGLIAGIAEDNTFDLEELSVGHYTVRGLSYHGGLIAGSIEIGSPVSQIQSDGFCYEFSAFNIEVDVLDCVMGEECTHLYFSEYIEGSLNNRALEIYNPTSFPVNLSDYAIFIYTDGATSPSPVLALSGILQPGEVYVVANAQASSDILEKADITSGVSTFSGNDAVVLLFHLEPIDVIGVIGEDPGTNGWTWQGGNTIYSTANRTFVREPSVNAPTTSWNLAKGQWHVYPQDDFSHLGSHEAIGCAGPTYIGFETSSLMVQENMGTLNIAVNGFNITEPIAATVSVIAGNAIPNEDYIDIFPIELLFTSSQSTHIISIEIIDDDLLEDHEFFTLKITEPSGEVNFVNQTITINIQHSDQYYPEYSIATITTNNSLGVADSVDVICAIRGIVHGQNLNPAGTEFTLIENHTGIRVFNAIENLGYDVMEGDSVKVCGRVEQFFGMTFFTADSIVYIGSGYSPDVPIVVGEIAEEHESAMIKIECVKLNNPTQWINVMAGFDVDITDGHNQYVMHIDKDVNLYGLEPLKGHFNVVGIGAQHDEILPYNEGYSIWPRYIEDIDGRIIASFIHDDELVFGEGGATVSFENSSIGATSYQWNFGNNQYSSEENPTHYYPYSFFIGIADVMITLSAFNEIGCSDSVSEFVDVVYSSVSEVEQLSFLCYPNPVNDVLFLETDVLLDSIRVYDGMGKCIYDLEKPSGRQTKINTSSWSQGIYFVEISLNNERIAKCIVKQ